MHRVHVVVVGRLAAHVDRNFLEDISHPDCHWPKPVLSVAIRLEHQTVPRVAVREGRGRGLNARECIWPHVPFRVGHARAARRAAQRLKLVHQGVVALSPVCLLDEQVHRLPWQLLASTSKCSMKNLPQPNPYPYHYPYPYPYLYPYIHPRPYPCP